MSGKTKQSSPLADSVNFGGRIVPLGEAIAAMQAEGHPQSLIDRWMQGAILAGGGDGED